MENADKEELLTLIAHKLRFVEGPLSWVGINDLQSLTFMRNDYFEPLKVKNLAEGSMPQIPKETNLVLIQLQNQGMQQAISALPQIGTLPGLQETMAKLHDNIFLIDDLVFNEASDLEQLEILAEVFYHKFFAFGHEGKAWVKLSV
ncbi:MAG: hypothetical protein RLZ47_278 [Bacteroidota bacterium]|jgi:hypothetical protein